MLTTYTKVDGKRVALTTDAYMLRNPLVLLVRSGDDAGNAEAGGRAIASLFSGDRQKISWAWATMWERAGQGVAAEGIVLAGTDKDDDPTERLVQLKHQAMERQGRESKKGGQQPGTSGSGGLGSIQVRQLKEIAELEPDDGEIVNKGKARQGLVFPPPGDEPKKEKAGLGGPTPGSGGSGDKEARTRTVLPPVGEREQLAFDAVQAALRTDPKEVADLRNRRGIGADAMDELRQLYELKMISTSEFPSEVTLTRAEVDAAQNDPDFFLAVVCGLEDSAGDLEWTFTRPPSRPFTSRPATSPHTPAPAPQTPSPRTPPGRRTVVL